MKRRLLGPISDFVVEDMPKLLQSRPEDIVRWCDGFEASAGGIAQVFKFNMPEDFALRLLDLKMLETGIVHSGLTPPTWLVELVDRFSGYIHQVPVLTYEDLVFVNPPDDRRTFARGEVRRTERAFYAKHALIETCLDAVITKVSRTVQELKEETPVSDAVGALDIVENRLDLVLGVTASFREMRPDHFAVFRKYLNSHPVRDLKGPSGAFTASIPILEVMTRGDELPREYFSYLTENLKYFPRAGQRMLKEVFLAVSTGDTLVSLWHRRGGDPVVGKLIEVIGVFLNKFRRIHYRIVEIQIPGVISGELAGTGGEKNPGEFLRERKKMTRFTKSKGGKE